MVRPFRVVAPALFITAALLGSNIATPALAGSAPPSPLKVVSNPVAIPNAALTIDSGEALGFGDAVAKNGLPDGWRAALRAGGVAWTAGTEKGAPTTAAYQAGTEGGLVSKGEPATPGETWVLRTRLDPGPTRKQPATVGIAFLKGQELLDYALHRVETEFPGLQDVDIRATAPAGTDTVRARWVFSAKDKPAGSFQFTPLTLERMSATSRERALALPHIFLITIETFRFDHSSAYGYSRATTPNLARIASEGAIGTRHIVQAPYTRPSLSSMVTSRYPASLGITENIPPLPASATTMAELFASGGYVTAGFVAQFLLSAHYGFNQGFHYFYNHPNDTNVDTVYGDFLPWSESHLPDNTFVWSHLFDPHGPYRPPEEFSKPYEGDAVWQADTQQLKPGTGKLTGEFIPAYVEEPGQAERRQYVARYDGEISYVDARLGKLIDWINAKGIADKSLVIITADHGESMTDHGRYFAHGSLYDHDLHVPLVVWAPGRVKAGTVLKDRTTHLDLLPTMLDYAGMPIPKNLKGSSLRGAIEKGEKAKQPFSVAVVGQGEEEQLAVYSDDPLTVFVNLKGEPTEAYELANDPGQLKNLIESRRTDAERIAGAFRTWMAAQLKDDAPKPKPKSTPKPKLTDEETEQLRALGYLE